MQGFSQGIANVGGTIAGVAVIGGLGLYALTNASENARKDFCYNYGLFCQEGENEYEGGEGEPIIKPEEPTEDDYKGGEGDIIKPPEPEKDDPIALCRIERKKWNEQNPQTRLPGKLAGVGERCSGDIDCSANGMSSGTKVAGLGTLCGCDKGFCAVRRQDYLGILFNPSECKKGLFDPPGSCVPNRDELPIKMAQKRERENWLNCKN
jgi:hypothetical protein